MGYLAQSKYQIRVAFVVTILCVSRFHEVFGMRPLEGDHWLQNNSLPHIQSLRGDVPPTGGNPCTYIPRGGKGRCTFEMDVAGGGHVDVGQEALPGQVVQFAAAASVANDTEKQDPISS